MTTATVDAPPANGSQIASEDVMREQAYLIARSVRPLALLGHCEADPLVMLRIATALDACASGSCIPFVIDRGDGFADYGFAAAPWVVELYSWAVGGSVPEEQRTRIVGLVLGYGVEAIRAFEDQASGRLFQPPSTTASRGRGST